MSRTSWGQASRRGTFPAPAPEQRALRECWRQHPSPVDLSVSNPTRCDFALPNFSALLGAAPATYEPSARGALSAREAIAATLRLRADVTASEVMLTASTSESYSFLLGTLCDPGDAVLVPRPSYPLFEHLAQLAGVRTLHYDLSYDGSWHLDRASLPSGSSLRQERVRAVLSVSPNNPTGSALSKDELLRLRDLGLPLVVDEVFRPFSLTAERALRAGDSNDPLALELAGAPLVLLDGLSKRLCAPGLKLAWMVVRADGAQELLDRLEWYGDTFLSVSQAVQHALPQLLSHEAEVQRTVTERLRDNCAYLRERCAGSALTCLPVDGGWNVIVRFPHVVEEQVVWGLCAAAGVWVQPGHFYDLPFASSVVLSLLTPTGDWQQGVQRLLEVCAKLAPA